jgi:hypothetical protein
LELVVRYLVALFVLAIAFTIFLDSVVGKVDNFVPDLINIVVVGRGANIALTEPVGTHYAVETAYHHVMTDIKFSTLV